MATSNLLSQLNKLSKSDLIDLLVLSQHQQKNPHLCDLKGELDATSVEKNQLKATIATLEDEIIRQQETIKSLSKLKVPCDQSDGLNYGVGMAYSYFYGYLKLIIPNTGDSGKNLKELMQDYEDTENIEFEFYKLFILIPKSLYCPPSLEEVSSRILKCRSLPEKKLTVAGVQNRPYMNPVYKISREGSRPIYVVAEYATPVKTFRDVFDHFGEHSDVYKKNKDQVVNNFYRTLKNILLESEACKKYCELIFYDDKDQNGDVRNVADFLIERMEKLKRETNT